MKKILHIETFPFSPHLETSAEIAITNSKNIRTIFAGVVMIYLG